MISIVMRDVVSVRKPKFRKSLRLIIPFMVALTVGVFFWLPDYRRSDWLPSEAWPQQDMGEGAVEYSIRSTLYACRYPFLVLRAYVVDGIFNINLFFFSGYYTPLPKPAPSAYVLALSRDKPPVEMITPASAVRFMFDLDGDGDGEKISWVNEKGMILFHDLNNNNFPDNSDELLGVKDQKPWSALIALDSNNDYILDYRDAAFAKLRLLWDKNGNQKFSRSEIFNLSKKVKYLILSDVNPVFVNMKTNYVDPVTKTSTPLYMLSYFTSYIPAVAVSRMPTVLLHMPFEQPEDSPFPTLESRLSSVPDSREILSSYKSFPNLKGFGGIADLHAEMYGDPVLKKAVGALSALSADDLLLNAERTNTDIEALLLRWSQVEGVDPSSRGWFIDARFLTILEKMSGRDIYSTSDLTPLLKRSQVLKGEWDVLYRSLRTHFLLQTDIGRKIYPGGISYDNLSGKISVSGNLSEEYLSLIAQKSQTLSVQQRRLIYQMVSDLVVYRGMNGTDDSTPQQSYRETGVATSVNSDEILSNFRKFLFPSSAS